jgi:hypothetical protein
MSDATEVDIQAFVIPGITESCFDLTRPFRLLKIALVRSLSWILKNSDFAANGLVSGSDQIISVRNTANAFP